MGRGRSGKVRYLLDTTLLIDHVNGIESAMATLERLVSDAHDLLTCDVVTCEALSGGSAEQQRALRHLLDALEFVAIDPEAARWAAASRREGRASPGRGSLADALIAAVAWRLDATIVTRNVRDFGRQGVALLTY
jgi:predicted nucleic acid-binding protein